MHPVREEQGRPPRVLRRRAARRDVVVLRFRIGRQRKNAHDDGGEYLDFPGKRTRKAALDALAGLGIDHGWDDPTEGDDVAHVGAGNQDRPEYDVSHPVYEILDPEQADVELHLVPIDGTSTGVEITQNGKVEYSEVLDRGFWNNRTIRDRVASEVANTLTGVDQAEVKRGVKDALNQVGIDEREEPDAFEADMRSDREQELRDRTIKVVCHPTADSAEWVVTMDPPAESPVTDPRDLSFTEGDFNDGNAGTFKNLHVAKFYTKVEIDHKEWDDLTDHWLSQQVTTDYEPDLDLEAAVDKFAEWAENLRVWADEDGFSWSNLHGYYVEDYHDGEDAVLVPGQKVADWKRRENIDPDLNLSKELRERGIMVRSTLPKWINGKRRRVWPVSAEAVGHSADTALRTETDEDDEDGDDRPEGLR